ncbi:PTS glucose transporter subunit IIA [Actinobacteria bacterium YIM 96077]|uniref:PTS glucose transporter subunit IIA n=1 Tax=Phytoactinopolyspora halophila TaxID=1981511 RepID=A0A329QR05_9ACTN|nr:PTS glucose transporter subunit IIA [Phytoactinopolyspora halophila]AYY14253.1 PTS glucose transporter subunit IIA [Actinobacteria bacterium YIM 96077]RAW14795.1 PTS glucose transporter subunit IIA [Phytoactinopolyspora halophila]
MTLPVMAPVAGWTLPLTEVPDPVFSTGMLGPGLAIEPERTGARPVLAPLSGTIAKLHPHAFIIRAESGTSILVHLGIDTVRLDGSGFRILGSHGVPVKAGEPIIVWDPDDVEARGYSPICPVVALDAPTGTVSDLDTQSHVIAGGSLFTWIG